MARKAGFGSERLVIGRNELVIGPEKAVFELEMLATGSKWPLIGSDRPITVLGQRGW